jgi:hypothetical protein
MRCNEARAEWLQGYDIPSARPRGLLHDVALGSAKEMLYRNVEPRADIRSKNLQSSGIGEESSQKE